MALIFKKTSDLIDKIRQGDQQSFELFYNQEFEKIYRFVSFKISERTETEEIVQDIFFSFWDHVRQGKDATKSTALLYKIARNKIIDNYRKHGVRPNVLSLDNQAGFDLADSKISDKTIEKELDVSFEIESVQAVMVELPDDYKDILIMRFMREMRTSEIAQAMDKSEGAVRVMVYRALKLLKKLVEEKND